MRKGEETIFSLGDESEELSFLLVRNGRINIFPIGDECEKRCCCYQFRLRMTLRSSLKNIKLGVKEKRKTRVFKNG